MLNIFYLNYNIELRFKKLYQIKSFRSVVRKLYLLLKIKEKAIRGDFKVKYIERTQYLNFLLEHKDKQIIKVLSGIRHCGKSTLFEIYKNYLLTLGIS